MFTPLRQLTLPSALPPTSLDLPETPDASETASSVPESTSTHDDLLDTFRHSGWKVQRRQIYEAMSLAGVNGRRRAAFATCGTGHWVLRSTTEPDHFKVVPDHCHDRFCVPCGGGRQAVIRRNLARLLPETPHRFLTLTIRHAQEPLAILLTRLYRAFRLLRNRRLWKDRVRGGVAFLELTYNADTSSWNPHLHCMLSGLFILQSDLSKLWLACTGDSHTVHIQLIRTKPEVTNYITKYTTKPLPASVVGHADALLEALRALARRRMVITFGSWKNWKLLEDPADDGWELFDHLNAVRYRASLDDALCEVICSMVDTADPHTGEFVVNLDLPPPDD